MFGFNRLGFMFLTMTKHIVNTEDETEVVITSVTYVYNLINIVGY